MQKNLHQQKLAVELYFTGPQARTLTYLAKVHGFKTTQEYLADVIVWKLDQMAKSNMQLYCEGMAGPLQNKWFSKRVANDWKEKHPVKIGSIAFSLTSNQVEVLNIILGGMQQEMEEFLSYEVKDSIRAHLEYCKGSDGAVPRKKATELHHVWKGN